MISRFETDQNDHPFGFNLHLHGIFRDVPPGGIKHWRVLTQSVRLDIAALCGPAQLWLVMLPTYLLCTAAIGAASTALFGRGVGFIRDIRMLPLVSTLFASFGTAYVGSVVALVLMAVCVVVDCIIEKTITLISPFWPALSTLHAPVALFCLLGAYGCARLLGGARPSLAGRLWLANAGTATTWVLVVVVTYTCYLTFLYLAVL